MLDQEIIQKRIYGENMHIYQVFINIRRKKINCETALTEPITLNDETMYLSEWQVIVDKNLYSLKFENHFLI